MKPQACKLCDSRYHTKMSCPQNKVAVAKAAATKKRMQLKAASKPKKPRAASKIKKIVDEIEKINVISKENVGSIDNVSQASEHLHVMTENLNNELGKFKS